ncbi:hypothetical protein O3G_MSEX007125 [Manduca sexta]|uniref:CRC domain-containing protein n=1 Tax=Manduca sexta TaxID=7130 RepID=A0A921Z4W0_MANSE|nr:hypothetical protein O3G_MSEX007125 [Manduca sexta]
MDHNLDDSLNLEGAMESMDFDNSGVVVNQADITLETSEHEGEIPMEFEEQQMLMDTGSEEIIVTDFMGEQFSLQEYSVQDEQTIDSNVTVELNQIGAMTSQSETMIDLQLEADSIPQSIRQATAVQPKFVSVKAPASVRTVKKAEAAAVPRQVAIAPKPPKLVQTQKATFSSGKQYAIAPKPVALVMNKSLKKVSLTGVQGVKGNSVIRTPVNKQFVMLPTDGSQKIKLMSARTGTTLQCVPSSSDHAQLIPNKTLGATQIAKPIVGKVIVQGGTTPDANNQPAVIRKLLPAGNAATRYVMQPKTVPIYIGGNKVLLASPTKQGVKLGNKKQQIIAIKSSPQKVMPVTTQANTAKKVVITANPNNVILKTTAPPKGPTVSKDGNIVLQGQRTQLHQINVPGKGIQYIRLITNSATTPSSAASASSGSSAPAPAPKPGSWGPPLAPAKSFVLTDTKGNLIQMTAEKMVAGQPPPLVITGNVVPSKQERKLVRIAPVTSKTGQLVTTAVRSSQSLLAPVLPSKTEEQEEEIPEHTEEEQIEEEVEDILEEQTDDMLHAIDIKYERMQSPVIEETAQSMESNDNNKEEEHPLIVIPSTFRQIQTQYKDYTDSSKRKENIISYSDDDSRHLLEESNSLTNMVNVDAEIVPYQSPQTPQALSESDLVTSDLGLRPRKACNCTKSQCLKLYCDCFANGEFCNHCNCNNCHNNLENEELRQKAIRACLDRNPNAFRPKIGKAKSGGPEIIRRHNKGCNCKRSGCLKNYCECYEAKIACTAMCKCVGCRNVEETLERRRSMQLREKLADSSFRPPTLGQVKQPCSFMTTEVIEAVCQCLVAAAVESGAEAEASAEADADAEAEDDPDPMRDVIEEFARCLQEIIGASHHAGPQEGHA